MTDARKNNAWRIRRDRPHRVRVFPDPRSPEGMARRSPAGHAAIAWLDPRNRPRAVWLVRREG